MRTKKHRYPLTAGQVNRLLKKWCDAAGIDAKCYTGHCLRRGGLTWAHQAGITGEALKVLGDWGSMAYLRYIDHDLDSRIESGKKMAEIAEKWC